MKIYTKGGDTGETGLFGGERVSKDSLRIESYGTVDELNSFIGLAILEILDKETKSLLYKIQNQLFTLGSDLAAPDTERNKRYNIPRVTEEFYIFLESEIDKFESRNEELKNFILPGGSKSAALLHICRTICRRGERNIVSLSKTDDINKSIIIYLNRLSDLFFVLARHENKINNTPDIKWEI